MLSKSRKVRKREEKNSCGRMHEEKGVLEQEFIIFQTRYGRSDRIIRMCREAQASPLHFQAAGEV